MSDSFIQSVNQSVSQSVSHWVIVCLRPIWVPLTGALSLSRHKRCFKFGTDLVGNIIRSRTNRLRLFYGLLISGMKFLDMVLIVVYGWWEFYSRSQYNGRGGGGHPARHPVRLSHQKYPSNTNLN